MFRQPALPPSSGSSMITGGDFILIIHHVSLKFYITP
jgi:hypothetical protein